MPRKTAGGPEKLFPKGWLPKTWEEGSRFSGENQITFKLYHINPEINMAPELTKGAGQGKSISEYESIVYHGISTRRGLGMKDFFEGMTALAETGMVPSITPASVQDLKNRYQKADIDVSGKYDLDVMVSVVKFPDEKLAEAQFLSFQVLPTQGFTEMPIPVLEGGGTKTLGELLKSDSYKSAMKSYLSKEQFEQLEKGLPKMQEAIEKASKQIKEEHKKAKAEHGIEYYKGKYQGHPAIIVKADNPQFKGYSAPKPVRSGGREVGGGGGVDPYVKLPPRPNVVPPRYTETLMAIQVGNFVINGSLLWIALSLPPGNTFCHSLTKFQTKVEVENIEGKIFRTTHILPVNSTLAAEGYLHKEEVENIFSSIFSRILSS